jgi:hypothetical protein
MKSKWHRPVLFAMILVGMFGMSVAAQAGAPQASVPPWKLVWSDEFNGPNGSAVDSSKWVSETGGGGWGNNELEYYTNRIQNAWQQDGNLVIKVLQEKYTGADGVFRNYTFCAVENAGKVFADIRTLRSTDEDSTWTGHLAGVLDAGQRH